MTKKTARDIAADVVKKIIDNQGFSNVVLDKALSECALSPQDKALCTELVYGTLRYLQPLDASLRRAANKPKVKFHRHVYPHLLLAAYQLQYLSDRIPSHAAVNCAVNSAKRIAPGLAGFTNALLRNLGSPLHLLLPKNTTDITAIANAYGVPKALAEATTKYVPITEREAAVAALNERPITWFKWYGTTLPEAAQPHPFVPGCIQFATTGLVTSMPGFKEGIITVQDPASQLAACLMNAQPGQTIVDLCAAPGSKSVMLAKAVGPTGKVIALDINAHKALKITENAKRLHAQVSVVVTDALKFEHTPVDAVLLDAPCSASGTTRRHPEVKWRMADLDFDAITQLQAALLEKAHSLVKPGGALVYSVCSPMPQEGTKQIEAFLKQHPEYQIDAASHVLPFLPGDAVTPLGELILQPYRHQADGFYAIRLMKNRTNSKNKAH